MRIGSVVVLALLVLSPSVRGQQPFEAVVSGRVVIGACLVLPIEFRLVQWINPDRVDPTEAVDLGSADGQRVLALLRGASSFRIVQITPDRRQTEVFTGPAGQFASELEVAASGRMFVWATGGIMVISPSGVLEATHPLPDGAPHLAVGPDGCTLFFLQGSVIRRINGCTGAALPDFASVGSADVTDLFPLPDGGLLVARRGDVLQYDVSGALTRTVATLSSYGFGPGHVVDQIAARDGVLWIAAMNVCVERGTMLRVTLDSGAELSRRELEMNSVTEIVLGAGHPAPIPTLSEVMLVMLALAIAAAGALALKLR